MEEEALVVDSNDCGADSFWDVPDLNRKFCNSSFYLYPFLKIPTIILSHSKRASFLFF
jgi:hypothetical protein